MVHHFQTPRQPLHPPASTASAMSVARVARARRDTLRNSANALHDLELIEFHEPWFLEENKWWKPPWSGISVENYLGVKTHQRTRFKPWWFHERLPSFMCQWRYLKWFPEIHGPFASPWHADEFFALDGTSLVSRPSLLKKNVSLQLIQEKLVEY